MFSSVKYLSKGLLTVFTISILLFSCANHKFKVKGEIYGAEEKTLVLEKSDFYGRWLPVDSVKINKNGGFSISFPVPPSPEIFRLNLNDRYVYFPVNDKETITLLSSYDNFGRDFKLDGSPEAVMMEKFEKDLQSSYNSHPDSLINFKRSVFSNYMKDNQGSIIAFYILTKTVDDKPLYDPSDPLDKKYFGAVATGFKEKRPDDPHTALLEQTALQAQKNQRAAEGKFHQIEAEEISLIDIDLQNENGQNVKLSSVTGKGKPVVVIFSLLNHPDSPEFNIKLAKIYNRLEGKVEFYNVSLDEDQYEWREAAKNLPWITVYSPGQNSSKDAVRYNVFQVPSFYIYDANGELSSRPMTLEELNQKL
ncbi:MAG: DUF4369 domain-containing protein [Muribaculaceae bacterium]|nr:DUF4369 domain-containing protein [Muribaculaceae bacterium]